MPARVATIKINVLPRIHFVSSMLPILTPVGFWQKRDSKLKKFIWNGKKPCHWFDAEVASPWKTLEQEPVHPLQDVDFSVLKHKKCYSQFGPIISYVIKTMVNIEKYMGLNQNGICTPLFGIMPIYWRRGSNVVVFSVFRMEGWVAVCFVYSVFVFSSRVINV